MTEKRLVDVSWKKIEYQRIEWTSSEQKEKRRKEKKITGHGTNISDVFVRETNLNMFIRESYNKKNVYRR